MAACCYESQGQCNTVNVKSIQREFKTVYPSKEKPKRATMAHLCQLQREHCASAALNCVSAMRWEEPREVVDLFKMTKVPEDEM